MGEVVVSGIGALTAVGASAAQTCASIRAGLIGLRRHPDYIALLPQVVHEAPSPVACGFALEPLHVERSERILRLATASIRDLVRSAGLSRAQLDATQVVLCVGKPAGGPSPTGAEQHLADELGRRLGLRRPLRAQEGAAPAVLELVRQAREHLLGAEGGVERFLIVAVDCLVDNDSLPQLDHADRLQSERTPDGFLPGEAGCCFLLEPRAVAAKRNAPVLASVVEVGLGREQKTFATERNATGEGLCEAIRGATRPWPDAPLGWVIHDMNGESYRGYEWGIARVRLSPILGASELWHPADSTGSIGVAAPALAIVLACTAFTRNYAPASRALICCGADGEERAACTLQACPTPAQKGS
jgi:3-oxoacyl-[acyl-carrier-protein] synthase-1